MNSNEIIIPCRIFYAHVWEPSAMEGSNDAKYSVCLAFPKTEPVVAKIKAMLKDTATAGAAKWGGKVPANLKMPLRDGDAERPDDAGYAGCYFINANSSRRVPIIDRQCRAIMDQEEVYSGCYCNVKVSFFPYNTSGNRGIGCGLVAIQKVRDGERMGGGSGVAGFEELPEEELNDLLA